MDDKNLNNDEGVLDSTAEDVELENVKQKPNNNTFNKLNNFNPQNNKVNLQNNEKNPKTVNDFKKVAPNQLGKNVLDKKNADIQRLNQALNKRNQMANQAKENQEANTLGQKVDKVGEEAVRKLGGKAITAATGGAVSGPAADAIANAVAKPLGKTLKYGLLISMLPLFFIVFFCFSIFAAFENLSPESNASTTDDISATTSDGVCDYNVKHDGEKISISDVKVQLLQCKDGERGKPIEGEELVDLEKYILGVVYAEIGGGAGAGAKAQAIAARSFTLALTSNGSANGEKLEKKDGVWVASIRNCTESQVYCDPDKGCTVKNGAPSATNNTVYSGKIAGKQQYKGPMAQNDRTREAIASTAGQVALNAKGEVKFLNFDQNEQTLFDKYAKEGMDAYEILKKVYNGDHCPGGPEGGHTREKFNSIQSSCQSTTSTNEITGDFTGWKQCNAPWSNIEIGSSSKNICKIGCAATSISIQIASSKTNVSIPTLNPGTFVETLNKNGGFTSKGSIFWEKAAVVAPKFKYLARESISGNVETKANKLREYLNNNEYVIIGVHKSANDDISHWVALNKVVDNDVYMFDPGSSATKLFDQYPYTKTRDISIRRYKLN